MNTKRKNMWDSERLDFMDWKGILIYVFDGKKAAFRHTLIKVLKH